MYVFIRVYLIVCIYACVFSYVCMHMHMCICVFMYLYQSACMCVCEYTDRMCPKNVFATCTHATHADLLSYDGLQEHVPSHHLMYTQTRKCTCCMQACTYSVIKDKNSVVAASTFVIVQCQNSPAFSERQSHEHSISTRPTTQVNSHTTVLRISLDPLLVLAEHLLQKWRRTPDGSRCTTGTHFGILGPLGPRQCAGYGVPKVSERERSLRIYTLQLQKRKQGACCFTEQHSGANLYFSTISLAALSSVSVSPRRCRGSSMGGGSSARRLSSSPTGTDVVPRMWDATKSSALRVSIMGGPPMGRFSDRYSLYSPTEGARKAGATRYGDRDSLHGCKASKKLFP